MAKKTIKKPAKVSAKKPKGAGVVKKSASKSAASKVQWKQKPLKKSSKDIIKTGQKYFTLAVKPREVVLDRGKGSIVWDTDGNDYIDLGAGIAVNSLGHCNKELSKALQAQSKKIWHTSNVYFNAPSSLLSEELVKASKFAKRVFFCNSGAEANEAAIKIARKYAADKGKPASQREIITFYGSFHGRTLATVTATAQPKYHEGFEPLPGGFKYCAYNDIEALKKLISDKTCAVMLEVVQGEGGITPVVPGFLKQVQDLCHKHDALLILDQVQCGMMRTGYLFSHFAEKGVKPDIVTTAKALGGGMPIGATLMGPKVAETFVFGSHGSTFGGHPVSAAVAREVLKKLQSKSLQNNVQARGKQLMKALEGLQKKYDMFTEIRGRGLMIGAELKPELHGQAAAFTDIARKYGVLMLVAGPNVLRFLPPLVITEKEMAKGIKRFERAVKAYLEQLDKK